MPKSHGYTLPWRVRDLVCDHLNPNGWTYDQLRLLLKCKLRHGFFDEGPCSSCLGLVRCPRCYTEVLVENKTIKSESSVHVLVTTEWQYMRNGSSSTDSYRESPSLPRNMASDSILGSALGDIRDPYEANVATPFDSICTVEKAWKIVQKQSKTLD